MEVISKEELWAKVTETSGTKAQNQTNQAIASEDGEFPAPDALPAIDIPSLRSALASLDPDCEQRTWMVYRVGALANSAIEHPEFQGQLYELAWQFSSGMLAGKPAQTWTKKGPHGTPRKRQLAGLWQRFLRSTYTGNRVKVDSIFYHARQDGWTQEGDFEEVVE